LTEDRGGENIETEKKFFNPYSDYTFDVPFCLQGKKDWEDKLYMT
jgi:hypothetical protein